MKKICPMNLLGLDLNSTRLLAVTGPEGLRPRTLALDGKHVELPLVVSLQGRKPELGGAGVAVCRCFPHLVCLDFLPYLGEPRTWVAGRHRLDADKALALALERLRSSCTGAAGVAFVLPAYLSRPQAGRLAALAEKLKLPILGMAVSSLAIAAAAHAEQPWSGLALLADVDDHALTWTALAVGDGQASILGERCLPHLNARAWKGLLIDAVADRCVRKSRRDPRDSAVAEQMLYAQLDDALAACRKGRTVEFVIQSAHWYQNLILRPEEVAACCASLVRQAVDGLQTLLTEVTAQEPARLLLVTEAAGRLPGLPEALRDASGVQAQMALLPAEAAARAAHDLAVAFHRDELPHGHVDITIPLLSKTRRPEAGGPNNRAGSVLRSGH